MQKRFRDGTIGQAPRADLDRYLSALALLQVRSEENRQRAKQMGDTIRMLISSRDAASSS